MLFFQRHQTFGVLTARSSYQQDSIPNSHSEERLKFAFRNVRLCTQLCPILSSNRTGGGAKHHAPDAANAVNSLGRVCRKCRI